MNETKALAWFTLRKHAFFLKVLVIILGIGVTMAFVTPTIFGSEIGSGIGISALVFSFGGCALLSIVLFNYDGMADLVAGESGCNRWVLGMPIQSWKIAIVPTVLRTLWLILLAIVLLIVLQLTGLLSGSTTTPPHILRSFILGSTLVAAFGVWLSGIGWRPYSNGWWRLAALGVLGLLAYGALIAVAVTADERNLHGPQDGEMLTWFKSFVPGALILLTPLFYLAGVWFSICAVRTAKTQSHGIVNEVAGAWAKDVLNSRFAKRREHKSDRHALLWFFLARSRPWLLRSLAFMVPGLLVAILFFPVNILTLIIVFLWTVYTGAIGVTQGEGHGGQKTRYNSTIPPQLATSPLSTATIAWMRFATHAGTLATLMLMCMTVFVGWMIWPENRETWWQWATECAAAVNAPDQVFAVGLRWSIVIVVGVNAMVLFRWVGFLWVGYSGRDLWTISQVAVSGAIAVTVVGILTKWFITHATDWDTVRESAHYWLQYLPHLLGALLTIKLLCAIAATAWIIRWDLVTDGGIVKVLLLWLLVAGGLGLGLWALIPDTRATLPLCLALTVLAVPLARVMVLPAMLQLNRVR